MPEAAQDGATRVGTVVSGRYRIEQLLGEGGMGAVYLAEHTHMRKRVALKLLHKEMSENAEVLARFEREAMAASHIEHPNVASATDFGRAEDGSFFLVLEYIEGTSLRSVVGTPLPPRRALHIARQIALALERAHDAGIVHRDLKPENVMLVRKDDDPDFVKVLDFGIAKVSDQTITARGGDAKQPLTRMGTVLGTPEYMAPEQALGEAVTPPSDLYAVGIMLYEMLTGLLPFDPPDRMAMLSFHIVAPVPPMADRVPAIDVPPAIEAVVRKLLEKDAKARYTNARELAQALEQAAAASGIELGGAATPGPPESSARIAVASPSSPTATTEPGNAAAWQDTDSFAQTSLGMPAAPKPAGALTKGVSIEAIVAAFKSQPMPIRIALGAAPVAMLLVLILIVSALRSSPAKGDAAPGGSTAERSEPAKPQPKLAPPDDVRTAAAQGEVALDALAKKYPDDPSIPRQAVLAVAAQGRTMEALTRLRAILKSDPGAASDPELLRFVTQAAEGQNDEAFALLETGLGERGVDTLIEMSGKGRVPYAMRASRALLRPDVRANASPAAAVYLEWKDARTCPAKRDLLDRVKASGDARMLVALRKAKETRGCGFLGAKDCYPCLRKDDALDDAISAVEARAK